MAALSVDRASVGKATRKAAAGGFGGEAGAKLAVGGHSAGDEDADGAEGFGGGEGFLHQVADHGVLEAGDEVEGLLRAEGEGFFAGLGGRGAGAVARRLTRLPTPLVARVRSG